MYNRHINKAKTYSRWYMHPWEASQQGLYRSQFHNIFKKMWYRSQRYLGQCVVNVFFHHKAWSHFIAFLVKLNMLFEVLNVSCMEFLEQILPGVVFGVGFQQENTSARPQNCVLKNKRMQNFGSAEISSLYGTCFGNLGPTQHESILLVFFFKRYRVPTKRNILRLRHQCIYHSCHSVH